jgi:hypothetical protein
MQPKNFKYSGCFSRDCIGPVIRVEGIMKAVDYRAILEEHMLPHAKEKMAPRWIFQQDNDPKHASVLLMGNEMRKARAPKQIVAGWFKDNDVTVLQWPSQSPDLNPIEHLWEELDRRLRKKTYKKLDKLMEAIKEEWQKIPLERIIKLVDSMPKRCQAVIDAKGYSTKY